MKKTTFDELLLDVAAFDKQMDSPQEFYIGLEQPYRQTAAMIARRILMHNMPEGRDRERWRMKVNRVVESIVSYAMLHGGLEIGMKGDPDTSGSLDPKESRPYEQSIHHSDVVEWIKAGENGLPGGKRITSEDRKRMAAAGGGEKGYNAVATIVMRAYYSRKPSGSYVRLRRAIQKYLHGDEEVASSPLLDAVAAAWVEHFTPRLRRDLNAHVSRLVREF